MKVEICLRFRNPIEIDTNLICEFNKLHISKCYYMMLIAATVFLRGNWRYNSITELILSSRKNSVKKKMICVPRYETIVSHTKMTLPVLDGTSGCLWWAPRQSASHIHQTRHVRTDIYCICVIIMVCHDKASYRSTIMFLKGGALFNQSPRRYYSWYQFTSSGKYDNWTRLNSVFFLNCNTILMQFRWLSENKHCYSLKSADLFMVWKTQT